MQVNAKTCLAVTGGQHPDIHYLAIRRFTDVKKLRRGEIPRRFAGNLWVTDVFFTPVESMYPKSRLIEYIRGHKNAG